ncbi:hypothetical protein [Nocardia nova]|uniref:hypothetical protein n=1 Tax=Nocardia nova TaxID=37330 RepID=UPI0011DDDF9F|nr:hypothetical protein [Nocardia nova]
MTDRRDVKALPAGSIISWLTYPDDPESEVVAIVGHGEDGDVRLAHTGSAYWLSDVNYLVQLPCTVIRYGRTS